MLAQSVSLEHRRRARTGAGQYKFVSRVAKLFFVTNLRSRLGVWCCSRQTDVTSRGARRRRTSSFQQWRHCRFICRDICLSSSSHVWAVMFTFLVLHADIFPRGRNQSPAEADNGASPDVWSAVSETFLKHLNHHDLTLLHLQRTQRHVSVISVYSDWIRRVYVLNVTGFIEAGTHSLSVSSLSLKISYTSLIKFLCHCFVASEPDSDVEAVYMKKPKPEHNR